MLSMSNFTRCAMLVAICLVLGACGHATKTIEMKTPDGTEKIPAPMPATVYSMARMLDSQGRHQESEALLRQVIADHPDYVLAYYELSDELARQHRMSDALAVLEEGLEESPKDPILLNNAGMCHLAEKNYKKALKYFERASTADPADNRYKANQALALAMQGKTKNARELYMTFLTPAETEQNLSIIEKTRLSEEPKSKQEADNKTK